MFDEAEFDIYIHHELVVNFEIHEITEAEEEREN